jgi:23S rRNA (cytidine1920-2'-O)/16S rRNA (cytidine1409-2'-O)-methyltransferase
VKKQRLDRLMVERGLAPSRERARALILARQVEVGGVPVDKAGAQVAADAVVRLRQPDHPYVSRGALKLEAALDRFALDPAGAVVLDVGASTGGFTDLLLRRGAIRCYAVDVGYGQLAWSLRSDERVIPLERENIRHLDPAKIPEPCDLAVIDVSFISLTLVLDKVAALMGPPAGKPIVCLVKPQFEVGRGEVGKGGVVRDPAVRAGALDKVRTFAAARGFQLGDAMDSPIPGPAGNLEFLLLLRTPAIPGDGGAAAEDTGDDAEHPG